MKKLSSEIAIVFAVLLVLAASVPARQQGQRPIDRLKYPPLKFTPPVAQKVVLPSGMTVFLLEDSELPLVNMFALIKTGGRLDPPGKAGLAELTATVLRTGGTKSLKPDEINQKLEFVAASVETDMDTQYGTATLSTLSKDLDTVLPIYADVLMNPAFDQSQIEIARGQMLDAIKRQNDSPQEIAQRVFPQIIYGRHSPLAESPTEESVKSITRDDIEAFYRKYYSAGDVTLGISGDIHKDTIVKKIEDAFAGWKTEKAGLPAEPEVPAPAERRVYFIHRDINQTSVRVGNPGIKEGDPDFFKLTVANQILGGGFTSRIFNELRTKEALAYAAAAGQSSGLGAPGYLFTFSETRANATVRGIETILNVIQQMREQPVTDEELQDAKDSLLSSFVFNYDEPEKIVNRQVVLDYFGMPPDYLQKYRDSVGKVTKEDVLEVAKKYYQPDKAMILVIGDEKQFDKPLSSLGPVTTIDLDKW